MPEIRKDIVSGSWVIIATERAKRPETFTLERTEKIIEKTDNCPFCYGREHMTPPEVLAIRNNTSAPDEPGWDVRVIPNKFPALSFSEDKQGEKQGLFEFIGGKGVHEVIVETPDHDISPGKLPVEHVKKIVDSYYHRFLELEKDQDIKYIQIFRNHGKEAGASIEHPHSQLMALPILPPSIILEMEEARKYYFQEKRCVYCNIIEEELERKDRIITENQDFIAFIPYAARLPFETWIVPKRHQSSFSEITMGERQSLADILQEVLSRLWEYLNDPPYNYYLHTSPTGYKQIPDYHWHFEVVPKLTTAAGFELGAGMFINISNPEASAEFMRKGH